MAPPGSIVRSTVHKSRLLFLLNRFFFAAAAAATAATTTTAASKAEAPVEAHKELIEIAPDRCTERVNRERTRKRGRRAFKEQCRTLRENVVVLNPQRLWQEAADASN